MLWKVQTADSVSPAKTLSWYQHFWFILNKGFPRETAVFPKVSIWDWNGTMRYRWKGFKKQVVNFKDALDIIT